MRKLGIVEAFRTYGAVLRNHRWAVSAVAADGAVVVSCWESEFRTVGKTLRYEDNLSRWAEVNVAGRDLLIGHLTEALQQSLPVRLVVAHWAKEGSRTTAEYFHVRPDLVGQVTHFDGDRFTIDYVRAPAVR